MNPSNTADVKPCHFCDHTVDKELVTTESGPGALCPITAGGGRWPDDGRDGGAAAAAAAVADWNTLGSGDDLQGGGDRCDLNRMHFRS